jgi:hypothetical protein
MSHFKWQECRNVFSLFDFFFAEVQGVQVEELWSLDPEQFDNLK